MVETKATQVAAPSGRTILFFLALSFIAYGAHELIHHFTLRGVCGRWGTMTLSQFFMPVGCEKEPWWIATLAGPVLTYTLIWIGAVMRTPFGLLLFFANLPLARAISVATRSGDEMVLARMAFDDLAWPAALAIAAALLVPPLVLAWKQFPRSGRWWRVTIWLVLPVLWDFTFKRQLLAPFVDLLPAIAGIPVMALIFYAVAVVVMLLSWPRRDFTSRIAPS